MAGSRLRHAARRAFRRVACRPRQRRRVALPGHHAAIATMVLLMMLSLAVLVAALTLW